MNRPVYTEFKGNNKDSFEIHLVNYIDELNKYCDELEEENNKLYCLKDKRFEELIKALDKACEELEHMDYIAFSGYKNLYSKEQWKEWAMEDE